jgi:hypothetical protein
LGGFRIPPALRVERSLAVWATIGRAAQVGDDWRRQPGGLNPNDSGELLRSRFNHGMSCVTVNGALLFDHSRASGPQFLLRISADTVD